MNCENLIELWLKSKKIQVKKSTYSLYSTRLKTHILPAFGETDVKSINEEDILDFILEKSNILSPKTLEDIMIMMKNILNFAFDRGLIPTKIKIDLPSVVKKEKEILTEKEKKDLESYLDHNLTRINLGILFTLYSGIRIGELCALKMEDIKISKRYVNVCKTLNRIKNIENNGGAKTIIHVDVPKTPHSFRKLPIIDTLMEPFQNFTCADDCYFLTGTIHPIEPRLLQYHFYEVLEAAGIKKYSFHALRHTFATFALQAGMDVKTLSEILGHSSVKFTLETYCHSNFETKLNEINKLNRRVS